MKSKLLKDKVAIVTGASKSLGFETSRELTERGVSDIICSRSIASAQKSASMTLTEGEKAAMENSMKSWGDPRDLATIAADVASEDFAFSTGNTIVVDGATVML
jgi:NAD(P)-dependent dehydrogenase (short-subunit alcohol dehydrogenase family)